MNKKKTETDDSLLSNFEFDTPNVNDFFGVAGSAVEPVVTPAVKVEKETDESTLKEPEEPEAIIPDEEFSFVENENDSKNDDKSKKESKDTKKEDIDKPEDKKEKADKSDIDEEDVKLFTDLANDFKEMGLFTLTDLGDEEITPNLFFEKVEEEVSNRANGVVENLMTTLDDDAASFLKFKSNGGDTRDFFKLYGEVSEIPVPDVDSEENQEAFLRYYYSLDEDLDLEDIDDRIVTYSEKNTLEKYAKKHFEKLEHEYAVQKQTLLKQQEEAKKQQIEHQRKFQNNLKTIINTEKQIGDLVIDPKKDSSLVDFITKPIFDKETKLSATSFQTKIGEIFNDEKKLILLAKLVQNDFDFSSVKKKAESEANKKTLHTIRTRKEYKSADSGKSLIDYFK